MQILCQIKKIEKFFEKKICVLEIFFGFTSSGHWARLKNTRLDSAFSILCTSSIGTACVHSFLFQLHLFID